MKRDLPGTKIISEKDAEVFRRHGWRAADLHVHTLFSSDVIPSASLHPLNLYQTAKQRCMDFVTFTDHDTMQAYDSFGSEMDGLIRGVEIKIKDMKLVGHTIHVNIYELNNDQFTKTVELSKDGKLCSLINYLKEERLPFVYNHPLWFEPGEKPNLEAIPEVIELFPVVEYNMHRIKRKNEIIMALAERYGKGVVACTDTHSGMIGQAYTISRGKSFREFYNNICRGESYIVVRDLTKHDLMQEMKIWLDLLTGSSLIRERQKVSTGMPNLDRLISILASQSLKDSPCIYHAALALINKIARSGLPAALYIRRESSHLFQIEQILGLRSH
ncbi:MAG: PHP domain-containing protein [Methanothrix sp.]|jgi:hypothetical protein|nr:PHP domain-containing protein [Methanothrix sp.]